MGQLDASIGDEHSESKSACIRWVLVSRFLGV
jgi:hypothetical protein